MRGLLSRGLGSRRRQQAAWQRGNKYEFVVQTNLLHTVSHPASLSCNRRQQNYLHPGWRFHHLLLTRVEDSGVNGDRRGALPITGA